MISPIPGEMNTTKAILKLIRVKQWIKNLFLFIPLFFAGDFLTLDALLAVGRGFISFSLAASSIYILNDYIDREADRAHPKKKMRPLASGAITPATAFAVAAIMLSVSLINAYLIGTTFFTILCVYIGLNVLYTLGLKNVSILDLFIVALGFELRIYGGGAIAEVPVSQWLSIMILLLALFLVLAKRRDDLVIAQSSGKPIRKTSASYNLEFVNSCLTIFSAVILVSYIMYTLSPEVRDRTDSQFVFVTAIFVLAGLMRYLQITYVEQNSGEPTNILFKDVFIILSVIGWVLSFYLILYVF